MSRTTAGRAMALLVAALTLVPLGLAAPAAQAVNPVLNPANRLGDITLDRTSGEINAAGRPQTLTTAAGCPEGYRGSSRVLFVWPDGTWPLWRASNDAGFPALPKAAGTALEGTGLDGNPIVRTGTSAARWSSNGFPASRFDGRSGVATYVVTCDPGDVPAATYPTADVGVGDSKYFSVDLRLTWVDGTTSGAGSSWEVVPEGSDEKVTTTTTLTGAAQNDGSVRITAAVEPSAATGSVTFKRGDGSTIATEDVSGGAASTVVGDLDPDSEYTFTAEYSGDQAHEPSVSGTLTVTTVAEPLPPQDTEVTVTIPAAASGLQFTVSPDAIALGQAQLTGGEYTATGSLQEVRVTDNRENRKQWTLNGRVSDFDGPGDATIAGSALGWEPALVGSGNAGTAGTSVAPGTGGGLSSDKPLAQAPAGVTQSETRVGAGVTLRAPAATPGGDYSATLTLTLI